ncbi:MAG: amidohydrolase family protein, partial [Casimicrobiaceae bacterium]
ARRAGQVGQGCARRQRAAGVSAVVRTIDVHAHILCPELMGVAGNAGLEMGVEGGVMYFRSGDYVLRGVRFTDSPFSDISKRLALMDRMGIDLQVLSPNPLTYFYAQPAADAERFCRAQNDAVAAVVRAHPDRFAGLAQLPMQAPALAVRELERAVRTLGLRGSYVGSDIAGMALSDPAFEPVWTAHEVLDVPVVVHPAPVDVERPAAAQQGSRQWDLDIVIGFAHDETTAVAHLIYGGVLARHPRLRVHIPHGGGTAPYLRGRIATALARRPWGRALLERPFDALWSQLSFDCLVGTASAMAFLIESEGASRVMLGTNFAGWDQEDGIVAQVRAMPLTDAQRSAVLGGSAARWFNLR